MLPFVIVSTLYLYSQMKQSFTLLCSPSSCSTSVSHSYYLHWRRMASTRNVPKQSLQEFCLPSCMRPLHFFLLFLDYNPPSSLSLPRFLSPRSLYLMLSMPARAVPAIVLRVGCNRRRSYHRVSLVDRLLAEVCSWIVEIEQCPTDDGLSRKEMEWMARDILGEQHYHGRVYYFWYYINKYAVDEWIPPFINI